MYGTYTAYTAHTAYIAYTATISILSVALAYLMYVSCYKNVSLSPEKCGHWFKRVRAMDTQMKDSTNVDDDLKKFCW